MSMVEGEDSAAPSSKKLKVADQAQVSKNGHRGGEFLSVELPELSEMPDATIDSYASLYRYSVEHSDEFWSVIARRRVEWTKPFSKVCSGADFCDPDFRLRWFEDGQLNVSVNCVDRHYKANPKKVALIWDQDEPGQEVYVTYEELYHMMNRIANMLRAKGVKKGDRVAIYMPSCTTTVAVMLACARIGAIHSVVFAGFSAEALASRIIDSQCSVLFTANQTVRAGKAIELKKTVDAAVRKSENVVKHVFVYKKTEAAFELKENQYLLNEEMLKHETECEPEVMDAEDPLFMLYTSGSTGKPKAIVHTQAGYLVQVAFTFQTVFNYQPGDIFGCLADVGWITGHSYVVYGPLCNGGTTVLFESSPIYPNPGRYWETVQRLKINQLYIAPTAIRLLIKYGCDWVKKYDRSSLKCLGSVGEPINHEAWHWYHEVVGEKKCKISDTWWQTETGAHMITPFPAERNAEMKPAMAMRPFFGISPVLVDEKGAELESKSCEGVLCIRKPWPSMARTIYGDHQRYLQTYLKPYPGFYFTGDGASVDADGHFQITGRIDDVMNVSGHRIGTAEVEDALDEHHSVAESAVVAYPHDIHGDGIYAFIILKENVELSEKEITEQLKALVKSKIVAYAVPHIFLYTANLPKTRSGKIMRRILRKIAADKPDELGDITTLADPTVVEDIIDRHNKMKERLQAASH